MLTQPRTNSLEKSLTEVQEYWNTNFSKHMKEEANKKFPASLQQIRDLFKSGKYDEAAIIAHNYYSWAAERSEVAEVTGPGFAYFSLFRQFNNIEEIIKSFSVSAQQH